MALILVCENCGAERLIKAGQAFIPVGPLIPYGQGIYAANPKYVCDICEKEAKEASDKARQHALDARKVLKVEARNSI